jgi:hypothetical protein
MFKNGHGTNQATITIGGKESVYQEHPPCVTLNSKIVTKGGVKNASDIVVGDHVLTHLGRFRKVKTVYKRRYIGDITKIKTKGNKQTFFVTPEHPVYSVRASRCPYDKSAKIKLKCKPNCKKRISTYKKKCSECFKKYEKLWTAAENLSLDHFIAVPKIKTTTKPKYSKEEMFLFGLFLADGDYSKLDGIRFNLGKHENDLIQKVVKLMKSIYNLDPHFDLSNQGSTRITFYSRKITKEFFHMFYKGARTKEFPSTFLNFNVELLHSFITGYIAGDGSIRKKNPNNIDFYTTSKKLRDGFNLIMHKLGFPPTITSSTPKDSCINGRVIKSNGEGYAFSFNLNNRTSWSDKSYNYIPITSILYIPYNDFVFNYEVEEDNSYIVNGHTVHNCLRLIDFKIKENKLNFIVYFRSHDLWAGFPENLGGLQLLKEYMAIELGVEDGEIIEVSKGLHLYDYQWPIALARLNNSLPDKAAITKEEANMGESWMKTND